MQAECGPKCPAQFCLAVIPDATTTVDFPRSGKWRVWVRTKDWVARWRAPGRPGRFRLVLNGSPLEETFGTERVNWHWQDGGIVEVEKGETELALRDLTGFNGRCDAIYFTRDLEGHPPPNDNRVLPRWRKRLLGMPEEPEGLGPFDLVVVGGGYAGMCAAISAARTGLQVALIQERPVLGGNASHEIRVPLRGLLPEEKPYPHIGEVVEELEYDHQPSARHATVDDDRRYERIIGAEDNITLLLNHHVYEVEKVEGRITAVTTLDTRGGPCRRIAGRYFADCTGHATVGALADADYTMAEGAVMGMTNKWGWEETDAPQTFPETPWALDLTLDDFPQPGPDSFPACFESGFYRHPIHDLEYIRDWNLRFVFGAWNAMKNKSEEYENARLKWVAAIGGPRESRRLLGDVILSADDMVDRVNFDDGFVPVSWYLDRHFPVDKYADKYPADPFWGKGIVKPGTTRSQRPRHGDPWWGVPYRCLYSRNIPNLFMAGRNISTTYWGIGAVRVMRTCGMMGEVVGKAAKICAEHDCENRDVYHSFLDMLKENL